jgi:hypothetical protein
MQSGITLWGARALGPVAGFLSGAPDGQVCGNLGCAMPGSQCVQPSQECRHGLLLASQASAQVVSAPKG